MATSGSTKNNSYSIGALYEIIKPNLLMKDKDLIHFINSMNDVLLDEYREVKRNNNLNIQDISNRFEHYIIVFMMIRVILRDAHISDYNDKTKEITNFLLNDLLKDKKSPQQSFYTDED